MLGCYRPSMPRSSLSSSRALAALAMTAASVAVLAACSGPVATAEKTAAAPKASTSAGIPAPVQEASKAEAVPASAELSAPVQAQIDYALTYWQDYNEAEFGVLGDNDCVNFASQTLLARGWVQDDQWFHADDVYSSSDSWRSSTAFRDWLETRPDLATALDDSQRDQVSVGDIVQFDWDQSGDRDHTGVVTRVTHENGATQVFFAGHTLDSDYRSVDTAITEDHPGGAVYYWHIAS